MFQLQSMHMYVYLCALPPALDTHTLTHIHMHTLTHTNAHTCPHPHMHQVVQSCDRMVASGLGYTEACRVFSGSVRELSVHFKDNEVVSVSMFAA